MTEPFISRDDLAAYTQRTFSAGDDDLLAICLDSACQVVRSHISQTVNYLADDEVLLDGTGANGLLLPELPVETVTTVTIIEGAEETVWIDGTDFVLSAGGILWALPIAGFDAGGVWPRGGANVKVKYSHGYDLTNNPTTGPPVPADMRLVALQVAARTLTRDAAIVPETAPPSPPAISGAELSPGEMRVLDRYKQGGVA